MNTRSDGPDVKALLQANVLGLVHELKLEGSRSGNYWMCRSRAHDTKIGGMYVTIGGGMAGAWVDAVAGEKGDVINLISFIKFGKCKGYEHDTFAWAREFLGLGKMTPEQRERASREAKVLAAKGEAAQAADLEKNRRRAKAIYLESRFLDREGKQPRPFLDSVADRYLLSRHIDVRALSRLPGCLGWLPSRRHIETNTHWPVMTAGFQDDAGETISIHATFLALDGSGKAPIEPQRKIWPSFKGAAIRLWRGATNRSIRDANAWAEKHGECETLVLCEGVEDGLSSVLAAPEYRTWAVGSLANLGNITLPPCVDRVIVWRDNDWSKPQAAAQFNKGVAALAAQGAKVSVVRSAIGKDANDALRGMT